MTKSTSPKSFFCEEMSICRFRPEACYLGWQELLVLQRNWSRQAHGISAMNSINSTILKSLFMPFFFGTTLVSLIIVIVGIVRWGEPGSMAMLAGGLIYVAGMFLCTMFFNVPLNNALARRSAGSGDGMDWARYRKSWTRWNHVRTLGCALASALILQGLASGQLWLFIAKLLA